MKCPFRKITIYKTEPDMMHEYAYEEQFAECYGNNCPYYAVVTYSKVTCTKCEHETGELLDREM